MNIIAHDPGGKHRWPLLPGMHGGAVFSEDGTRRLALWRRWGNDPTDPYALWIGMNPSTAGGDTDDPTCRREIIRTRDALGLTGYTKVNVMDYRATDPAALLNPNLFPCSPANLLAIRHQATHASVIIAAWGTLPRSLRVHATAAMSILREIGKPVFCLGTTQDGSPRHPLYVRGNAPLIPFNVGAGA